MNKQISTLEELKATNEAPIWMDEFGFKTLQAGYLLPDETPRAMYRRLAHAAASYYTDPTWEEKFFNVMWSNWLCPASPVLSNLGTNRGLPISCLAGDTWLNTKTGGIQIKDIQIGDEVLTHEGRYCKVTKKQSRISSNDLFKLKVATRQTQTLVTGNHPVLTNLGWVRVDELNLKIHFLATNNEQAGIQFGKLTYCPISLLEKQKFDVEVFDIEVDQDHSFSANGIIFHNCNSIHVADTIDNIFMKNHELAILSKNGAGVGIYFGDIRGRNTSIAGNGKSEGIVPWAKLMDTTTVSVSQGCYDDKTEILTDLGWMLFQELPNHKNIKVAQFENNKTITFVEYTDYIEYTVSEEMYNFTALGIDLLVTVNHMMAIGIKYNPELQLVRADEIKFNEDNCVIVITNRKNDVFLHKLDEIHGDEITVSKVHYTGKVFCVSVPSKMLIVRRGMGTHPIVCGNSTRRGASAIYLPIEHTDIEEFLNIRRPTGDMNRRCLNINQGVCITNQFMEEMLSGDKEKRKLWQEILKTRVETGEPYLFFTDNVNENNPECYKANNLTVKTSNICCLAGETLVVTKDESNKVNFVRIDNLVGKTVQIWDGEAWVATNTFKQRGNDRLTRIYFNDKSYIDSNANHRWFVGDLDQAQKGIFTETLTKNLKINDYVEPFKFDLGNNGFKWRQIIKIEELEGEYPVYCPTLPTTGKFALANGIMTGNTEIFLHTDPDHSFVCCLSSLNLQRWDEWKDTDTVQVSIRFLDAVLSEYIEKSESIHGLESSRRSAIKGRALGLGVLGWHSLLQDRMLPFDSFDTMTLNNLIFKTIREKAEIETKILAEELGEPEWCQGFNRRNSHLIALAPTVSNSVISGGTSPGIEPIAANIFIQKSAKGTFIIKNKCLEALLEIKNKNTSEVWKLINEYQGSVQHLDFLNENEKAVFLTARELNMHTVVKLAAQRGRYIDQGQSLNLFFTTNASPKYIHEVHIAAYRAGLKSLYYMRSEGVLKSSPTFRAEDECKACEG